jgi:hypothetical protein
MKLNMQIAVLFILFIFAAGAIAAAPDATQVTYNPNPAVPGTTITLIVQLENKQLVAENDVFVKLESTYPFTVKPSDTEQNPRSLGTMDKYAKAQASFTVYVDPTAENKTYTFPVIVTSNGDLTGKRTIFSIVISGKSPVLKVVSTTNDKLLPGQEKEIPITIQNVGTSPAYDIIAEIQEDRTVTATGSVIERDITSVGASTAYLSTINPGERKVVSLRVNVSNTATIKNYPIPIKVSYRDSAGTRMTDTSYIGLKVFGTADLDATIKESSGTFAVGQQSQVTVEIFNKGLGKADFTLVEVSTPDGSVQTPKQFIGTLGPNDVDTVKTTIVFDRSGEHAINVKISYQDADSTQKTTTITLPVKTQQIADGGMNPVIIIVAIIVIAIIIWNFFLRKKKK